MTFLADHRDWVIIGSAVLVALVIVVAGALHVAGAAKKLAKRVEAYGDLPILATIEATSERLARTSENFDQVDGLLDRANVAFAQLRAARDTFGASLATVGSWLK